MSDESMITIEIRGQEKAALEAAHLVSNLFLSSGPCRLRRTLSEDEVQILVYADVRREPGQGGYLDPGEAEGAGARASSVNPAIQTCELAATGLSELRADQLHRRLWSRS
ncbi:hypothetical protein [Streptomyces sp. NPDC001903]|uniref:hypothetical protein n=1 Tax=Streptomyces sp. NPDC001903 TaxID=3364622 RepID=UPI0036B8E66F